MYISIHTHVYIYIHTYINTHANPRTPCWFLLLGCNICVGAHMTLPGSKEGASVQNADTLFRTCFRYSKLHVYIYIICIFHIFHRYAEVDMKCHDLLILCIEHPGTWPEQLAGFCGDCCDGGLSIAQWCSDSPNANAAGCGYTLHRIMWFRNMISTWLVMLLVHGLWLGIY